MKRLFALALWLISTAATSADTLTFGIVPQQSASTLARLWGPILKRISSDTGIELQFATATDIPTFEKRLAEGGYDIAYMNPYHYTVFHDQSGYEALARARDKAIKGILVVRKDSPIQNLSQLDQATIAFPAPAAFAASILPRAHLSNLGLSYTPEYVASHDSVYRAVAKGLFPAGGGVIRTFKSVDPEVREQLRVLWTTAGYTPHAIATHPRVSPQTRDKVLQALLELEQDATGLQLLKGLNIRGFMPARDADWDDVRSLDIELLIKQ